MPARDRYHDAAKRALVNDGWTITHDPLRLMWGPKDMFVDLGAERVLGAEKGTRKIAVEVKGFTGLSEVHNLEVAFGQYGLYNLVLQETEPERTLYLAVHQAIWVDVFQEALGKLVLEKKALKVVVFDEEREVITRWTE